jgi:hypothetical protein
VSLPEPARGRLSLLGDPLQECLCLGRIGPHGPRGTPFGKTGQDHSPEYKPPLPSLPACGPLPGLSEFAVNDRFATRFSTW